MKVNSSTPVLAVLVGLLYILIMTPLMGRKMGYTLDATPSFQVTRAIVETGDLFPDISVKQGYLYSVVYIPFYLMGKAAAMFLPAFTEDWVERKFMCWMNTVITGATLGMMVLTGTALGFRKRTGVIMALLYGFSTLAFPYARYDYNKVLAGFLLLLVFYFYIQSVQQRQWKFVLLSGISLALLVMVRLEMVIAAVPIGMGIYGIQQDMRGKVKQSLYLLGPLAAGVLFVILYNFFYWQGEIAGGYEEGEEGFQLNPFNALAGFVLSPGKSMFLFNPILLLFPFALRPFSYRVGSLFKVWACTLLSIFLLYCFWGNWWGGWGGGARHLVPLLPLVVLSLAALWEETETQVRGVLVFLGIAGFLVQLLGSFVDFNDVLLTLFNAGAGDGIPAAVMEYRIIWNPLLSQLLHHSLFFFNLPVSRWDFLFVAAGEQMPLPFVLLLSLLWLSAASGLGYAVMKKSELQAELQAE